MMEAVQFEAPPNPKLSKEAKTYNKRTKFSAMGLVYQPPEENKEMSEPVDARNNLVKLSRFGFGRRAASKQVMGKLQREAVRRVASRPVGKPLKLVDDIAPARSVQEQLLGCVPAEKNFWSLSNEIVITRQFCYLDYENNFGIDKVYLTTNPNYGFAGHSQKGKTTNFLTQKQCTFKLNNAVNSDGEPYSDEVMDQIGTCLTVLMRNNNIMASHITIAFKEEVTGLSWMSSVYAGLSGLSDRHIYTGELVYTVGGMMSADPEGIEEEFNLKIFGFAKMFRSGSVDPLTKLILCVDQFEADSAYAKFVGPITYSQMPVLIACSPDGMAIQQWLKHTFTKKTDKDKKSKTELMDATQLAFSKLTAE